jgi:hypothetical protein
VIEAGQGKGANGEQSPRKLFSHSQEVVWRPARKSGYAKTSTEDELEESRAQIQRLFRTIKEVYRFVGDSSYPSE